MATSDHDSLGLHHVPMVLLYGMNLANAWHEYQKRKRTAALQQKKETQTVQRSKILQSSLLTGISLAREQGASRVQNLESRTAALAKNSQHFEIIDLKACQSCGRRDTVYDFAIDKETDALLWALGSNNFGRLQYVSEYAHPRNKPTYTHKRPSSHDTHDLAAFRSNISSISLTNSRTVVATTASYYHPGNVFIAGLSEPSGPSDDSLPILDSPAPAYMMLGPKETSLWTSCANPPGGNDMVAMGGSEQTYLLSAEGHLLHTYNLGSDVRAIDWLSPNVAVGGTRARSVLLWDARTGGSTTRFHHSSGVTSVKSLANGSQTLVCGFDGMALYDVRMPAKPSRTPYRSRNGQQPSPAVLRLPFRTERPSVAMDVSPQAHLVATADDLNVIQLHSLLSGKLVGALGKPDYAKDKEYYTRLRFVDSNLNDEKPALMACQGSRLVEWSWGGAEDDEF